MLLLLTNNEIMAPTVSGDGPMTRDEIIDEIRCRFRPLHICTPFETMVCLLVKAIRLFNRYEGIIRVENVLFTQRHGSFPVPGNLKTVLRMDPLLKSPPRDEVSTLLGVNLILTRPLDATHEVYQDDWYRQFKQSFGFQFEWKRRNRTIYYSNLPNNARGVAIKGLEPVNLTNGLEDPNNFIVTDERALEWLIDYTEALVKIHEAEILRKAGVLGITNDATEMVQEGIADRDRLLAELKQRAIIFAGK